MGGSGLFGGESSAQRRARKNAEEAESQANARREGADYENKERMKKENKLRKSESKRAKTLADMESKITSQKVGLSGRPTGSSTYRPSSSDDDEGGFVK